MPKQKNGHKKPNFSSYKSQRAKPNDALRKRREREGIERAKRQRAIENQSRR